MTTPGATVQIRLKTTDDLESMLELARSLEKWFNQESLVLMAVDLKEDPAWLAIDGSQVVGFLSFQVEEDNERTITWMAVAEPLQRQGVGRVLIRRFLEDCYDDGIKKIRLWTQGDEEGEEASLFSAARGFFRACGFRAESIDRDYYGPGRDRVEFVLRLEDL